MPMRIGRVAAVLLAGTVALAQTPVKPPEFVALRPARGRFHPVFRINKLPPAWTARIAQTTWHAGCPVPISDLRALTVSYWDFQAKPQTGLLVVNKETAKNLRWIFKKLYRHGFLIQRIDPVEDYGGNDERSMEANNTSAFNCRDITLHPGKFSNHSWGRAIDINPLTNPYVKQSIVLPGGGREYLDRNRTYIGGILADSYIVRLFRKKGWMWGGDWRDRQDYQHFEKPVR
jgi:D-alanyl-D-alanine carboxypeptidase